LHAQQFTLIGMAWEEISVIDEPFDADAGWTFVGWNTPVSVDEPYDSVGSNILTGVAWETASTLTDPLDVLGDWVLIIKGWQTAGELIDEPFDVNAGWIYDVAGWQTVGDLLNEPFVLTSGWIFEQFLVTTIDVDLSTSTDWTLIRLKFGELTTIDDSLNAIGDWELITFWVASATIDDPFDSTGDWELIVFWETTTTIDDPFDVTGSWELLTPVSPAVVHLWDFSELNTPRVGSAEVKWHGTELVRERQSYRDGDVRANWPNAGILINRAGATSQSTYAYTDALSLSGFPFTVSMWAVPQDSIVFSIENIASEIDLGRVTLDVDDDAPDWDVSFGAVSYSYPATETLGTDEGFDNPNFNHYITLIVDGPNTDDHRLFIDGVLKTGATRSGSNSALNFSWPVRMAFGQRTHDHTTPLGTRASTLELDEIAVWNYALGTSEISSYASGYDLPSDYPAIDPGDPFDTWWDRPRPNTAYSGSAASIQTAWSTFKSIDLSSSGIGTIESQKYSRTGAVYVVLDFSAGNDGTGVASTTLATAEANPFKTLAYLARTVVHGYSDANGDATSTVCVYLKDNADHEVVANPADANTSTHPRFEQLGGKRFYPNATYPLIITSHPSNTEMPVVTYTDASVTALWDLWVAADYPRNYGDSGWSNDQTAYPMLRFGGYAKTVYSLEISEIKFNGRKDELPYGNLLHLQLINIDGNTTLTGTKVLGNWFANWTHSGVKSRCEIFDGNLGTNGGHDPHDHLVYSLNSDLQYRRNVSIDAEGNFLSQFSATDNVASWQRSKMGIKVHHNLVWQGTRAYHALVASIDSRNALVAHNVFVNPYGWGMQLARRTAYNYKAHNNILYATPSVRSLKPGFKWVMAETTVGTKITHNYHEGGGIEDVRPTEFNYSGQLVQRNVNTWTTGMTVSWGEFYETASGKIYFAQEFDHLSSGSNWQDMTQDDIEIDTITSTTQPTTTSTTVPEYLDEVDDEDAGGNPWVFGIYWYYVGTDETLEYRLNLEGLEGVQQFTNPEALDFSLTTTGQANLEYVGVDVGYGTTIGPFEP